MNENRTGFSMRKIQVAALVLLLAVYGNSYGQIGKISHQTLENNANCARTGKSSFKNRLKNFPFNNVSQICIVSYKSNDGLVGSALQAYMNRIKINQDTINGKDFTEIKILNLQQVERLTDIMFNYSHKGKYYIIGDIKCYMPRNAIVFLDSNKKILGFIEICFGCNHLRTSDKRIIIGEYCSQKYELIKAIFKESGISYGITEIE